MAVTMNDTTFPTSAIGYVRTVLRAPLTTRAWREAAYCLVGFPVALVGFVLTVLLLALGTGLTASLVGAVLGLLLVTVALATGQGFAAAHRVLARRLIGERIAAPSPVTQRPGIGLFERLDNRLRNGARWRCVAYVLVKLPVAAVGAVAVAWWVTGLLNLTTPLRWIIGGQQPSGSGGVPAFTPLPFGGPPNVTSLPSTLIAVAVGVGTLLVVPWFTRVTVAADRWLMRALLGPGELTERIRALEVSRALAVDDAAAVLRRLERDLHDGAQVRLVALAMSLDMVKQRLGDEGEPVTDPTGLRKLVDSAHQNATEAIADLRDLTRGIHPPGLDEGLEVALETLTSRSAVPVELTVHMPQRPTPAIETIAYFCVAEALTNVIKHSGATEVVLVVTQNPGVLDVRMTDNGTGGADPGAGSGLTGLTQRIATVEGSLRISSPKGGPTSVTVTLPLHA